MKTITKQTNDILNIYTILAIGFIIVGVIIDNYFLILLGAVVAVLTGTFINNIRTKHIINILKQNNLWTDELFEKKKLTNDEAKHMDGFD